MGNCTSSHVTARRGGPMNFPPSAKVVDLEGRLHQFRWRITAAEILSLHPKCYLCSADTMVINSNAPPLPADHVLQFGQIYFLMPLSKSLLPLSLQDLCALAIKASTALDNESGPLVLDENRRLMRFHAGWELQGYRRTL
ncbi:hypothetical protein Salat_0114900 [Sesamum alatum]|uniref:Uncharacterized protein n=1 Tax=Sesamum alatum TaxID=300844 RepID=A0AAE2CXL5_9LAMI|nr:hypothetical protein Salat_0114900 [Sesamum alatum]